MIGIKRLDDVFINVSLGRMVVVRVYYAEVVYLNEIIEDHS